MTALRRTILVLSQALLCSSWGCDSSEAPPPSAPPAAPPAASPAAPPKPEPIDLDDAEAKIIVDADKCDSGDAAACHRVGLAFRDGRGIERDLAKAREVFAQACEMGSQPACESSRTLDPSPPSPSPPGAGRRPAGPAAPGRRAP
jgi:hypothetical protein